MNRDQLETSWSTFLPDEMQCAFQMMIDDVKGNLGEHQNAYERQVVWEAGMAVEQRKTG